MAVGLQQPDLSMDGILPGVGPRMKGARDLKDGQWEWLHY